MTKFAFRGLALCCFLLGPVIAAFGQQPGSLADIMSEAEMSRMGLDALSPEQQEMLFQWISEQGSDVRPRAATTDPVSAAVPAPPPEAAPAAVPSAPATPAAVAITAPADNFGKSTPVPDQMRSHIPGQFEGWSGDTVFNLANGQIWRQRYATRWTTEMTDPEVIITRHLFGLHRMEVVGTGQSVPVTRIR